MVLSKKDNNATIFHVLMDEMWCMSEVFSNVSSTISYPCGFGQVNKSPFLIVSFENKVNGTLYFLS